MGKRAITELNAEDGVGVKAESLSRKKSRRDKGEKVRKPTAALEIDEIAPESAEAPPDTNTTDSANGIDQEKLEKAERKAAKKAKKEAKEARKAQKLGSEQEDAIEAPADEEQHTEEDKAARKAARKAEKKKLKDMAKAGSTEATPTVAPSKATSVATSAIASRTESAIATPEPLADSQGAYKEHAELAALPQSEIDSFLSKNFVTIEDHLPAASKLRPIMKFSYLPPMNEAQKAPFASFSAPTPIQAATWPALFSGRDMIGVAETGSGKTLAFGVPCIRSISSLPKKDQRGVKAVIVSPTRELASQIYDQLVKLATPANLSVVCVYGGVPKDPQASAIRKAHIVVATPGRLNDLIGDGSADLSKAEYVVLDEADRMLDKGFEEPIRQIIKCTASKRQTLMFTATWPPSVRELAATFMRSPVKITIGDNPSGELRANTRIKQLVEVVEPRNKE
jgi:ATP-dependent RNA helicase DBP3